MDSININDNVWVEVTDYGWQCLRNHYIDLFKPVGCVNIDEYVELHKKKTKAYMENGERINLTRFQLHELMNIFGSKCYVGANQTIKNNKIYFSLEGLSEFTETVGQQKNGAEELSKKSDELKSYLQREWKFNVHKKYQPYFEMWYENITTEQVVFFNAWMRGSLSPFVMRNNI